MNATGTVPPVGARNASFEWLRVVSMALIIAHHYVEHAGFPAGAQGATANGLLLQFLSLGGKVGVNIFVLIGGYFLSGAPFKISRLIRLWMPVFFYAVVCYLLFIATGGTWDAREAARSFLPITYERYWFASTYFALSLFSPFLNRLIGALDRGAHFRLLMAALSLWCFLPTVAMGAPGYSDLSWFMTLYLTAAYFQKYPSRWMGQRGQNALRAALMYGATGAAVALLRWLSPQIVGAARFTELLPAMNRFPAFFMAATLFLTFKNWALKPRKGIMILGGSAFGVYLLHDNVYAREFLWKELFQNAEFFDSPLLTLHAAATICAVFLGCAAIELARARFIERPAMAWLQPRLDAAVVRWRARKVDQKAPPESEGAASDRTKAG